MVFSRIPAFHQGSLGSVSDSSLSVNLHEAAHSFNWTSAFYIQYMVLIWPLCRNRAVTGVKMWHVAPLGNTGASCKNIFVHSSQTFLLIWVLKMAFSELSWVMSDVTCLRVAACSVRFVGGFHSQKCHQIGKKKSLKDWKQSEEINSSAVNDVWLEQSCMMRTKT